MPHEFAFVLGRVGGHGNSFRVELLLEEDGKVRFDDGT
jgi:hypothetical protein